MEYVSVVVAVTMAGLAGNQLADTWTAGSIFRRPQAWLRARRQTSRIAELLSCPFCLSHYTVALCLLAQLATEQGSFLRAVVYWLAAVKLSTLVQRDEEVAFDQTDQVDNIEILDD